MSLAHISQFYAGITEVYINKNSFDLLSFVIAQTKKTKITILK